jgi:hypothetical protein
MRGERDVGAFAILQRVRDDVAAAIDAGDAAQRAELLQHPFGAALLKKRGRWHAAKLHVLIVDPLFFANEPLQCFAQRGGMDGFGELLGERRRLAGNRRGLAGRGQMSVYQGLHKRRLRVSA